RAREPAGGCSGLFALFILENRFAHADALVADVGARIVRRRTDQLLDLLLRFVAEGTAQRFVGAIFLFHVCAGLASHEPVAKSFNILQIESVEPGLSSAP